MRSESMSPNVRLNIVQIRRNDDLCFYLTQRSADVAEKLNEFSSGCA